MNTFGLLLLVLMLGPLFVLSRVRPGAPWHSVYLPTLDGWRAIACALVVVDHTARGMGLADPSAFIHGQHGVNIFFGLSGLLITTKLIEEREQTGTISLVNFYRRRVFRLFPAAFVFLAVVAVLASLRWVPLKPIDFAACVFYLRNFCDSSSSMVTSHFWSLAIEEQFYLVVPVMILLLGTRHFQSFATVGIAVSAFSRWWFFCNSPGLLVSACLSHRQASGWPTGGLPDGARAERQPRSGVAQACSEPPGLVRFGGRPPLLDPSPRGVHDRPGVVPHPATSCGDGAAA